MKSLKIFLIISLVFISGCQMIYDPVELPVYTNDIKLASSSENLSSWTEIPAGDSLVTDSQVYLAGNEVSGNMLGLVGVAIDRIANSQEIEGKNNTLSIKFDNVVSKLVNNLSGIDKNGKAIIYEENNNNANLVLIPSARLISKSKDAVRVEYRLTVRFIEQNSKKKTTKNYYYLDDKVLPISGEKSWSSRGAEKLTLYSIQAFERLINTVLNDINRQYESPLTNQSLGYVRYKVPLSESEPLKAALLEKNDDYAVISNLFDDKTIKVTYTLVPASLLVM